MQTVTVKVLSKGQIVIPAGIRKKHNILPGDQLRILECGDFIYLLPGMEDPVADARGFLPSEPSLSDELLEDRKKDFLS